MRGADPRIVLIPGIGMLSFGKDKQTARVAGEYFVNTIAAIRGAESLSEYRPVPEAEKFRIEYWSLEEAKLRRAPAPRPLAGRVAVVIGAAGGIGRAVAQRVAGEGGAVVVADLDLAKARGVASELGSADVAIAVAVDAVDGDAVAKLIAETVLAFGGVDLIVDNAGLSASRSLIEAPVGERNLLYDVMAQGFLVAREAARVMISQRMGGDMIYIASMNSIVAEPTELESAAKADLAREVRALAAELDEAGIRVNGVTPGRRAEGSGSFTHALADGARTSGAKESALGASAQRTRLGQEVVPDDVAGAVLALTAGDLVKTTGTLIPVGSGRDGGFHH